MNARLPHRLLSLWVGTTLWMTGSLVRAQSSDELLARVSQHINRADAQGLSVYFHSNVDITIADKEQNYPKNQAIFVLREFFMNYPIRSFSILHKGNSGDVYYAIGEYLSTRGKFDANIFLKKSGSGYLIERISFEQGN